MKAGVMRLCEEKRGKSRGEKKTTKNEKKTPTNLAKYKWGGFGVENVEVHGVAIVCGKVKLLYPRRGRELLYITENIIFFNFEY
jgi:hypothetical protein